MKNVSRLTLVALATGSLALALTSCGGSSDKAAGGTSDASALVNTTTAAPQASGAFGSVVTLPDGTAFTLTKQAVFVPTKFSSGQVDGERFNSFDITVTNGTKDPLDLGILILTTTASDGQGCVDIFDDQNGLHGAPSDPVAPGGTLTFGWAVSCPGNVGDALNVTMTTDGTTNVEVKGKLV